MSVTLDRELILSRLCKFFAFWKHHTGPLSTVNAFIILKGKEDEPYSKSQSVQTWLTDHVLPDTCILFTQTGVFILASKKKAELLQFMEKHERVELPPVKVQARDLLNKDKGNIEDLMKAIEANGNSVGILTKEKPEGDFIDAISRAISMHGFSKVDVNESIAMLLSVKDEREIEFLQKASEVSCTLLTKYARAQAIDAIENDRKIRHSRIASGCEEALKNRKFNLGLDADHLDMCYPAIIQSKDQFSLKFSSESSDGNLKIGTMIFALGVRYHGYCSNVIRTYLVNPTQSQAAVYAYLFDLHEYIMKEIREGMPFSQLYDLTVSKVEKEKPALKDKLIRGFGFITGIEFRDSQLIVNNKCSARFEKNMSVNINIGFQDVEVLNENKKTVKESYWLGDIVLVGRTADGNGENLILTKQCRSAPMKITMTIKDEEEEEGEGEGESDGERNNHAGGRGRGGSANKEAKRKERPAAKPEKIIPAALRNGIVLDQNADQTLGRGQRTAILAQKTRNENGTNVDERMKHQLELYEKLLKDVEERLTGMSSNTEKTKKSKSNIAYKGVGQMPKDEDVKKLLIFVDKKYETVIIPIFGTPYPIHISTVKNVATSIAGDYTFLRINLYHPGAAITPRDAPSFQSVEAFYLKELTLQASNVRLAGGSSIPSANLNTAFRQIKELQKRYKAKEAEEREMEDLVEQGNLLVLPKPAAVLKDVFMRPNIFGKRIMGQLEAHSNGFRFVNLRGDKIEFLYNNIKHAFYQPCDGELIILIHFHLKNGVMLNKKKHVDIQFYTEVGEVTTDLDRSHGYSYKDRDDLESEQREREMRNKLKRAFSFFCDQATAASKEQVDFDAPFRDLGFFGAPGRSTVLMLPTSTCLIHLIEWPPLVVSMDEIDFVYFERVGMNIRTFDLVIVFKIYSHKPVLISSIPADSLDNVKNWLDSNDIFFSEGIKSLNWQKVLKIALDDPQDFLDGGGWTILNPLDDEDEVEDEEGSTDDEEFVPSGDSVEGSEEGSESASDESDQESDWSAENESDDDSEGLDSDESEGKDWEELEAIAKREDAQKDLEGLTDRRGKKRHASPERKSSHHKRSKKDKYSSSKRRR